MVLIDVYILSTLNGMCVVSVPLRGLWFLSGKKPTRSQLAEVVSVPLRGLWFLSASSSVLSIMSAKFPSPCGDYGSYLAVTIYISVMYVVVSVPLRGLWFLSFNDDYAYISWCGCFRPLAGIMVLILCGRKTNHWVYCLVSVPLRGLWFLSAENRLSYPMSRCRCFRPLAGIMVLINWD